MSPILRKLFACTGSDSFKPIRREIERSNLPLDSKHIAEEIKNPITPSEYNLSLRFSIQRLKEPWLRDDELIESILPFEELISNELVQQYQRLIETIEETKLTTSDEHPTRCGFVDIEDEKISKEISNWIDGLIKSIEIEKGNIKLSEDESHELEALSWFHFDSLITACNARSLEKHITEFLQVSNYYKSEVEEQIGIRNELLKNLITRYPLEKNEIEILVDLITGAQDENSLFRTMIKICNQYELGKRKGTIAKIMSNYFIAHAIQGTVPFFFKYGIALPTVGLIGGNGVSAYFDLVGEINEAKLMTEIRGKINKRISQSLIFNKYKFTQDRSLGEIIETLDRGKESTIKLLSGSMSMLLPKSVGIGTSLTGLTLISPLLSLINLSCIPLTFLVGNSFNRKISPIHKDELKAKEKVANELASVKNGIEAILTSPNTPKIERSVNDKMDQLDKLTLQRLLYETKLRYAAYFTFTTTQMLSSLASLALHWTGKISEGAVFANVLYSEGVSDPFKELVDKVFKEFPRLRENIRRMERILGESDKLDLPDGEKEKNRIPVSKLNNFNIFIKELKFKDILAGVDLSICEGDFVTIAGPSGVGKSTLLKNIAGLHQPESGSIRIGGEDEANGVNTTDVKKYGDESIYSIMSYSNQEPDIFPEMTLRENIVFYSEDTDEEALVRLLEYLNLHKFTDRLGEKINHFSGGEQVRIGLARALYTKPKILLLDEPTRGLDSVNALEVKSILEKIHKEGTTIVCVTHDEGLIKYSSELEKNKNKGKSIKLG